MCTDIDFVQVAIRIRLHAVTDALIADVYAPKIAFLSLHSQYTVLHLHTYILSYT